MPTPEERVAELKLVFPPAPKPIAVYKPAVSAGTLVWTSGHAPLNPDAKPIPGSVVKDLTLEQGNEAARQTGLAILATLRATLGSLNKVKRLVKSFGMVNCTAEFKDQPKVINGYSELMKAVFGDDA